MDEENNTKKGVYYYKLIHQGGEDNICILDDRKCIDVIVKISQKGDI